MKKRDRSKSNIFYYLALGVTLVMLFLFFKTFFTGYVVSSPTANGNTSLNNYVLLTSPNVTLLQLVEVYNSSTNSSTYRTTGYFNDYVEYNNVMSGTTYKTNIPTSPGSTSMVINGILYNLSYGGSVGSSNSWAQINKLNGTGNLTLASLSSNLSTGNYLLLTNPNPLEYNAILLQLVEVYNSSTNLSTYRTTGYFNDYVEYNNVMSGTTYKTNIPTSPGSTSMVINGILYNLSYGGSVGSSNSWAQIISSANPSCAPKTCLQLNDTCGSVSNGCNGTLSCGTCNGTQVCSSGKCYGTGALPCAPKTCLQLNDTCGSVSNGCNGTLSCGTCNGTQVCSSGKCYGTGALPCAPKTCLQLNDTCGSVSNGCGGTLSCGSCSSGSVCTSNKCVCAPKTCLQLNDTCGSVSNGCNGTLSCGTCNGIKFVLLVSVMVLVLYLVLLKPVYS